MSTLFIYLNLHTWDGLHPAPRPQAAAAAAAAAAAFPSVVLRRFPPFSFPLAQPKASEGRHQRSCLDHLHRKTIYACGCFVLVLVLVEAGVGVRAVCMRACVR